jgi:glutathione S-transferase
MLRLYHGATSVCAIKVRLILAEKNLPWESELLDLRRGDQYKPDYVKLNPNAVVPTLIHDGKVVTESTVILEYLNDAFPATDLLPRDPFRRAQARLWMKKIDDYLHAACSTITFAIAFRWVFLKLSPEALAERLRNIPNEAYRERQRLSIEQGVAAPHVPPALMQYGKYIGEMEAALRKAPYLAGEAYSLADAAATPYINRAGMLGLEVLWRDRPQVAAWLERMRARPSFAPAITRYFTPQEAERFAFPREAAWDKIQAILASYQAAE